MERSADGIGVSDTVVTRGEVPAGAEELPPGTVIAGYEIEGVAGRGGMGVVHRARDIELGRTVAVKVIGGERAGDPDLRALFIRESLTAASLEHPNVLPIYRAGDDDGRLFIAMRFVEGASLEELIAAAPGGLPPGRAARIVARVAEALDAAHARGLVHRDVKPANILVADPDGDEHVYLSDFGLTVAGGEGVRADGSWAGTLAYLAPEQIRGEALDARTDVYALGCVLFHALTGRPPFTGDEQAVLDAHLRERPPVPSEVAPGLPPALDDVVRRAMAKRPEDRFATAGELGRAALAARYDVALLVAPEERDAAEALAAGLRESEVTPLVAVAGDPGAAEGVRASGACAVLVGRGGLGEWARPGLAAARAVAARDRAFRLVLVLLPGAPDPGDPGLAYLADHPWVDLRAGATDALAATDVVRALRGADVPAGLPAAQGVAPYRGLEAFREEDASLYFGREQDVARVLERLRASRFVAVVGPSGSGKSSLVQAGLLPALRRDSSPTAGWRVLDMVPGARPLAVLAAQLAHVPGAGSPSPADLAADERALDLAVARALEGRPAEERVLVVVDQLEEAYTLCADEGERAAFLGNLVYAATIPGGRTVVIATMRADFYHRLAEHPALRGLVASQQVLLGPLDARNLRRAIEEPARRCGLDLEPGLTRRILTDVADRPGTLPLLEHLLLEVWRRRRDGTLTLEAYAASGGVEGALARRANEVYGAMDPARQAIARRVLLRLTQPGEGTEDTRRRAERRELVTDPAEQAEVDAVVDALAEARLVTTGVDDTTGEPVVEVTHEALIRGWPELRGWLDEDRDRLRAERRLADAAAEWDRGGRDEGALYRGARLLWWSERDTSTLNPVERDFLAASQAREERERASRRRRVRIAIAGLAVAVAAIAGIAVFAFIQRSEAADQRDVALSRQLAATARLQLPVDAEVGLLLAQDAYDTATTPQAEEVLREATFASKIRASHDLHQGAIRAVRFLPDGRVASAGVDGTILLWDPSGSTPAVVMEGHTGEVRDLDANGDATRIASAGEDGTVRVWTASGRQELAIDAHDGGAWAVAFRPDGGLVTGGVDNTIRLWGPSGRPQGVIRGHSAVVRSVAVSADGSRIVSGSEDETTRVWTRGGTLVTTFPTPGNLVYSVAISPDGRRVASSGGDYTVRVWTLAQPDRAPLTLRAAQALTAYGVQFRPDGHIVAGGGDGTVRVWTPSGRLASLLRGHTGVLFGTDFSADGSQVVSAGEDGTVRVWAWAHGAPISTTAKGADHAFSGAIEWDATGRRVLSAGVDGSAFAWTPGEGRGRTLVDGEPGTYFNAVLSPDGRLLATASLDAPGPIVVKPVGGGRATVLRGHEGSVWAMDFSPDGERVVSGGDDMVVRVWTLAPRGVQHLRGHTMPVYTTRFSDDGTHVVSADTGGTVRVWNLADGSSTAIEDHGGVVYDARLSADGRQVVTGGDDRVVRVWDLESGDVISLSGHKGTVWSTEFSADGRLVMSSGEDAVKVWDWRKQIVDLSLSLPGGSYRAAFSPDGRRIASTRTQDPRLFVSECETCGSIDDVLGMADERTTRELSSTEQRNFATDASR